MKSKYMILLMLIITSIGTNGFAQGNLLENGSFEADFDNQHYPHSPEILFTDSPHPWLDFNPDQGDDERWFIDSVWGVPNQNLPNPNYQNAYYSQLPFSSSGGLFVTNAYPWESGANQILQPAFQGRCFIGIDLLSDLFTREGTQTKTQNNCDFNSGLYTATLQWARAYPEPNTKFFLSLSDQSSTRRKIVASTTVPGYSYTPGEWNFYTTDFELKLTRNLDMGNHWFAITGRTSASDNARHYPSPHNLWDTLNTGNVHHATPCRFVFRPPFPTVRTHMAHERNMHGLVARHGYDLATGSLEKLRYYTWNDVCGTSTQVDSQEYQHDVPVYCPVIPRVGPCIRFLFVGSQIC